MPYNDDDDEFNVDSLTRQKMQKAQAEKAAALAAAQNDPELEAILMQTKQVQKDTLTSTQSSVRMIKETVQTADKTSAKLKEQGEQLDRIDATARRADENAQESYKSAKDLHKYKGFLPVSIKNAFKGKDKKDKDRELARTQRDLDKQESRLEGKNQARDQLLRSNSPAGGPKKDAPNLSMDETERQIDDDLDEISAGLDHLKMTGLQMNDELNRQNVTINRIAATTEHTDYTISSANRKIQEFM